MAEQNHALYNDYSGNCHCGSFRFTVQLPAITSAITCNCSLCHKQGYLWAFPAEAEHIKITRGSFEKLTKYKSAALTHEVCLARRASRMSLTRDPGADAVLHDSSAQVAAQAYWEPTILALCRGNGQ